VRASIDVVIPVLNGYELTTRCLELLRKQTAAHRTTVADDASTDGTAARLQADWPEVSIVSLSRTSGFSSACNRGVAEGSAEIVVLLNNDVECSPNFLERLTGPFADPAVGSVASLMLKPGGERIDSVGLTADVTLAGFPRHRGRPSDCAGDPWPRLTGPAGTAAAYRRSAWRQVGGLDEGIFSYLEDLDLALRLCTAGWRSVAAPDAIGIHLGSATHGRRTAAQRRHGGFARGYLLRRYGRLRGAAAPRVLLTEGSVVAGDLAISHDLAALRGRLAGWRAAGGKPRLPAPPAHAIDASIGLRASLKLRRTDYAEAAA
jgi:GT2 family glycosyltransferase